MNEYEQVRHSLIDMLEDLDDRLAKITHDVTEPSGQDMEGQVGNDETLDSLGQCEQNRNEKE